MGGAQQNDLPQFEGTLSEASRAPADLAALTARPNQAVMAVRNFVTAAREAAVRADASASQRRDLGVNLSVPAGRVSNALAALDAVVAGASRHPALAREAGLLPSDLERAGRLRSELVEADAAQERRTARALPSNWRPPGRRRR